jgi:hypothetical protein
MATATFTALEPRPAAAEPQAEARVYRCECGHALRVFGLGRHRVYFERDDAGSEYAVMNRVCPACLIALPGKNAA